jgi:hypothetical protein
MRRASVLAALLLVCALNSLLFARMGTVVTKDGTTFDGDITEDQAAKTVTVFSHGIRTELKLVNVQSVTYLDDIVADVNTRLAALDPQDLNGRLTLAQYAMDHHAVAAARDVLLSAQKIAPGNMDVRNLLERLSAQLRAEAPAAAVTQPATEPVVVQQAPATAPAASSAPQRTVDPDEINLIRQSELQDTDNVRVRIDPDVRREFTDYMNMTADQFSSLSPIQQAFEILDKGKGHMKKGVKILSDPLAIARFRRDVQHVLAIGCATSKCHGGNGAGDFRLFPQDNPAAGYTNFLILQQYSVQMQGRRVPLIDRQQPEQSLLLAYMLPPTISDMPHPEAKVYRGAVRNRADLRYSATLDWIRDALKPVTPNYSAIDLTRPPATQPSEVSGIP